MRQKLIVVALLASLAALTAWATEAQIPKSPNGIAFPSEYRNWRAISVTHREDKGMMRVILGNDLAIQAARTGANPWPDGAIMAKVGWKATKLEAWPAADVPGEFEQVEFMIKDAKRWRDTGGWGFARWVGKELKPFGKDADFAKECFACHLPQKATDYVFTRPPIFP
jgi:hypothetical protein